LTVPFKNGRQLIAVHLLADEESADERVWKGEAKPHNRSRLSPGATTPVADAGKSNKLFTPFGTAYAG